MTKFVCLLAASLMMLTMSGKAVGGEVPAGRNSTTAFMERLSSRFTVLAHGTLQDPAASDQNPGNVFLDLPSHQADLEVRADLYLDLAPLDISLKPRFRDHRDYWTAGDREGEDQRECEGYLNEYLVRWDFGHVLFLSYGRENLQWGPSYMLSPANPFFADNGRTRPKQEVAGMDFARMVWLPSAAWSLSLIANTDPGRQPIDEDTFEPAAALKIDYTGSAFNGGLVLSHRRKDRTRLGFFGGVTATDALLLYAEGSLAAGSAALYPEPSSESYWGTILSPTKDEDDDLQGLWLLGGAYTLAAGPTLAVEMVYNSSGYDDQQAALFYQLRRDAGEAFAAGGPASGPAAAVLGRTADVGLRLLRRHYLMVQFNHTGIQDVLDLTLRWTHNLDDRGSRFNAIAEYDIGDHTEIFLIGTVNAGGPDTEFGSFVEQQWMAGVQVTF